MARKKPIQRFKKVNSQDLKDRRKRFAVRRKGARKSTLEELNKLDEAIAAEENNPDWGMF